MYDNINIVMSIIIVIASFLDDYESYKIKYLLSSVVRKFHMLLELHIP
jgi:hypothetical protein